MTQAEKNKQWDDMDYVELYDEKETWKARYTQQQTINKKLAEENTRLRNELKAIKDRTVLQEAPRMQVQIVEG